MIKKLKTFIPILILLTTFYLSLVTHVDAQTASPSGNLLQKLDELKKEIASKAAEIKSEITQKVQDKAIMGKIIDLSDSSLKIETLDGIKPINFDEFTEVLGIGNKKITINTLEVGDNVASLGDFDDNNVMLARRIVYLKTYATASAEMVWGQIEKSQGSTINIVDKSKTPETITTNSQTEFYLGNNEASLSDAKVEKFLVARGTRQKDGSIRARFIYFIPSVGFIKPIQKSASPSANESNQPK